MYTLLLLEDEPLIRQGIQKLIDLESLAISTVLEAANGEEGLALLKKHPVDLVLADINMPKLNGLAFAKQAKRENEQLKIALITGYDDLDYAVSAVKIGVDDYVLKPVSRTDITDILRGLIDKKQKEQRLVQSAHIALGLQGVGEGENEAQKEAVLSFLQQNLSNPALNLALAAQAMGFSEGYFSQLFKKWFSIAFREYVLHLRLEKSKVLLLSTPLKNYEIAQQVGIADPNYFSACFKREYHTTPSEFRMQHTNQGAEDAEKT